jgi:hypothetical protein
MAMRTQPVRRRTDRIEDVAVWILIAAGLLVVLLSCGIGFRVHDDLLERGRMESAARTPTVARLLADSSVINSANAASSSVMVPATWQDPSGAPRTGFIEAPRGLHAGGSVAIWIDASGAKVPAPTSAEDAVVIGLVAGGMALGVGIGLLVGLWALIRRATLAANCARWEAEWREVAPRWIRGEG